MKSLACWRWRSSPSRSCVLIWSQKSLSNQARQSKEMFVVLPFGTCGLELPLWK